MSLLLIKANRHSRDIVDVTPEQAGWQYVGFRAVRLKEGERFSCKSGQREYCLTIVGGQAEIHINEKIFATGGRASPFSGDLPAAVYVPPQQSITLVGAVGGCEVGLSSAPAVGKYPARLIDQARMKKSVRGQGNNLRYICDILPESEPAEALLVVEVITPAGHSSSYPPHKHDQMSEKETQLEETYYHRLEPPQGFALQRVYTDDRSLDETMTVEDRDVVIVPRGYHPCFAPYGYNLYYLNTMAGPERRWAFTNDQQHSWMLESTLI